MWRGDQLRQWFNATATGLAQVLDRTGHSMADCMLSMPDSNYVSILGHQRQQDYRRNS
jgi:hypothetical protein